MRGVLRWIFAVTASAVFVVSFYFLTLSVLKPPVKEVRSVIKISLIKPKKREMAVRVEQGEKRKKKPTGALKKPVKKTELLSKNPKKSISRKKGRESASGPLEALNGNLPVYFVDAVRKAVEEQIFYPLEAIESGKEGVVRVEFTVDRSGKVLKCRGIEGEKLLVDATCIAVRRASIPPIPESVGNKELVFRLEVEYNLKNAFNR
ncbi:MAG: TonB family protein [Desulfurobacteriaceae bacterium]